jgi:2-dehydropantoate 2-reductase
MRIAVIGAGALGCAIAAALLEARHDVTLLARGRRLEHLRHSPLQIESDGTLREVVLPVSASLDAIGRVDLAICCVKMPDLEDALGAIDGSLSPQGAVLTVQNGVEAHEIAAALLPGASIVAGRVHGFFEMDGDKVRHVGVAPSLLFGCTKGDRTRAEALVASSFADGAIRAEASPDIELALWRKFMLAAALGSVGAALGLPAGQVCDDADARGLLLEALGEVVAVAQQAGVGLTEDDVSATMDFVRAFPPDATTSFQRDIERGGPSEFDALTAAVPRIAQRHGVAISAFPRLETMIRRRLDAAPRQT